MNRSGYSESYNASPEVFTMTAVLQGAGAAAPVIPPTTYSQTSSKGFCFVSNNCASAVAGDITRSATGVYTMKVKADMALPVILDIGPNVWGAVGTWSTILDYNPTTRVLSFNTWAAGGAAVDLVSTDFIRITFVGQTGVFP